MAERHYEDYVNQTADLQRDLSSMMVLVQRLRNENDSMRQIHEELKAAHVRLRDQYNETKQKCMQAVESKSMTEREYEDQIRHWKAQLEIKARDFEELQAQVTPNRDMDMIKIQIAEELEGPHRIKVRNLETEVEKQRDAFFKARRELELLRTEYEQYRGEQEQLKEETEEHQAAEVTHLKEQIRILQERVDDPADTNLIRLLKREKDELRTREKRLAEELEDLRREKDRITLNKEESIASLTRQLTEETIKLKSALSEKEKWERQTKFFETELEACKQEKESVFNELQHAQKEVNILTHRCASLSQDITQATADAEQKIEQERGKLAKERSDLQSDNARSMQQICELENQVKTLNDMILAKDLEVAKHVQRAREEEQEIVRQERATMSQLQRQLDTLQRAQQDSEAEYNRQMEQANMQYEMLLAEKKAVDADRHDLTAKCASYARQIEELVNNKDTRLRDMSDLEQEYTKLQGKYRDLLAREQSLVSSKEQLELSLRYMQDEYAQFQFQIDKERVNHAKVLDHNQKIWTQERSGIQTQLAEQIQIADSLRTEVQDQQALYKKKTAAYKKKIKSYRSKIQGVIHKVTHMDYEKTAALKAAEMEKENTAQRLREVERHRDELKMLMTFETAREPLGARVSDNRSREDIRAMVRSLEEITKPVTTVTF